MREPPKVSRQRKWQLKMIAAGRCQNCGCVRDNRRYKAVCAGCARDRAEAEKQRRERRKAA